MTLTTKERFNACMKLAEFSATKHDRRRQYEWKITLGFWALLAWPIAYASQDITRKLQQHVYLIAAWLIGATLSYVFLWLRGVWTANQKDKASSDHFLNEARKIAKDPTDQYARELEKIGDQKCRPRYFLCDWAPQFQVAATLFLLGLALFGLLFP